MRSNEFIIETVGEDQAIMALARKLGDYVVNLHKSKGKFASAVDNLLYTPALDDKFILSYTGILIKKIVSPKFKEPAINFIINNVYLYDSSNQSDDDLKNSFGAFGYGKTAEAGGTIYLNIKAMPNINMVYTVLAHELRHAVDWFKRLENNSHTRKAGTPRATSKLSPDQYIIDQGEVNARFTQALLGVSKEMPLPKDKLAASIIRHFDEHRLIDVFPNGKNDPRYKQLVKRAIKFFEAPEANVMKPGLIQRAIKFITAGLI